MPVIVPLSNVCADKMSRHDMITWVNKLLLTSYKKIEELHSGVAYCQLMETLIPGSVAIKRLKSNAKLEHEYIHNFRLFQSAFTKLEVDKNIPIEKLIKGKFQDNFEFLQWFKNFYDLNSKAEENLNKRAVSDTNLELAHLQNVNQLKKVLSKTSLNSLQHKQTTNTPNKSNDLDFNILITQRGELINQISACKEESNFYCRKLQQIKTLLGTEICADIKLKKISDVVSNLEISDVLSTIKNKQRRVSFTEPNNFNNV